MIYPPGYTKTLSGTYHRSNHAVIAQLEERDLGTIEVVGSNPINSSVLELNIVRNMTKSIRSFLLETSDTKSDLKRVLMLVNQAREAIEQGADPDLELANIAKRITVLIGVEKSEHSDDDAYDRAAEDAFDFSQEEHLPRRSFPRR